MSLRTTSLVSVVIRPHGQCNLNTERNLLEAVTARKCLGCLSAHLEDCSIFRARTAAEMFDEKGVEALQPMA